ncbi:MAG: MurR/RpiR family transcriptional regulator [Coprobacillaceae bacterium]
MNLIAAISLRNDPLIDFNKPFLAEDSIDQVVNNMGGLYVKTIHDTEQLLDYKVLSEVIDILSVSKVIDVYGVGISYQSAAMFQYKMMSLDQVVRVNHSSNDQIKQAQYSTKDTVAIIISYSGETREICEIVDEIKKREGTIIAITSTHKNYLRIRSNYCLTLCTKEKDEYKLEAFSSKISADYIMDLIYSMLFQKKYNVYLDDKRERTHQING